MKRILFVLLLGLNFPESQGQSVDLSGTANAFLNLLSADVKSQIQFKLDDEERFNWHYVPRFRNGVSLHDPYATSVGRCAQFIEGLVKRAGI
jgi:hypothetical protein